jgi:hypothetical protein
MIRAVSIERYQCGVSEERYQLDPGINWTPVSIERYQKSGTKRAVPIVLIPLLCVFKWLFVLLNFKSLTIYSILYDINYWLRKTNASGNYCSIILLSYCFKLPLYNRSVIINLDIR